MQHDQHNLSVLPVERKLSEDEYRQEFKRLESAIAKAKEWLKLPCSLAQKIERKAAVRAAEESLRLHKLNYFELVDSSRRRSEAMAELVNGERKLEPMRLATQQVNAAFGREHPEFTRKEHDREVNAGDTRLREYWEWVVHQIEGAHMTVAQAIEQAMKEQESATQSLMDDARWIMSFLRSIEAQSKHAPTETMQRLIDAIGELQVTPRIVIGLEGGIIQGATANVPIEYLVYDYDIEGADSNEVAVRPALDGGGDVEVFDSGVRIPEIDTAIIDKVFAAAEVPIKRGDETSSPV